MPGTHGETCHDSGTAVAVAEFPFPTTRTMPVRMLYPVSEVAIQLGVSERTVYRLMDSGELPSVYVIDSRRVEHDQLVAYIARQRELAQQSGGVDPDEGGAGTGPGGGAGTGPRPPYPPKPGKVRP